MELTESVKSLHVPDTPSTRAWPPSLPSVADFPRDARDLGGEGPKLVDHGVDRVLELQHLAANIDGDLARQIAVGDSSRHLGDVADLAVGCRPSS
jgi:hypothetical protein